MRRQLTTLAALLLAFASASAEDRAPVTEKEGFRVVHLYGTPEEIGRQHAAAFADEIKLLRKDYLGKYIHGERDERETVEGCQALEPFYLPRHRAELAAMAETADMSWDDAVLATGFLDVNRTVLCSTFVGHDPESGEPVFGRNLDFPAMGIANEHGLCIVYHPAEGRAFASFAYPGMIGVLTGMNDAGLTVAVMNVFQEKKYQQAMPYILFFRTLLEECTTTAEVLARAKAGCCNVSNNLMVCDAEGDAALLEISPTRVEVRRPKDGLVMSTNHFRSEALGKPVKLCYRYPILKLLLEGREGEISLDRAIGALRAVAIWPINLQSFVLLPARREVHVAMGKVPACAGRYVPIDLAKEFARPRD